MSQSQTFNNTVYSIPVQGDLRWGPALTRYLAALGTYAISPAGGTYTLTADLILGASFGVLAAYFRSAASNIASTGFLRLAHADGIDWRNNANSGDLALTVNSSDQLLFNGSVLNTLALPVTVANGGTGVSSLTTYAVLLGGTTTTGPVQDAGTGSNGQVLTSQGPGAKPIWSAAGTGSGTVNTGTANQLAYYASSTNAVNGLTAITASRALASDANGLPVAATTTATELGYVNGVTSAIQTQLGTKAPLASPTFTGTVTTPGLSSTDNIAFSPTTKGITGTTTNDNAAAGNVGESVRGYSAGHNATGTGQWFDVTSISLTAGDWDIAGQINFNLAGATATQMNGGVSITTGNSATGLTLGDNWLQTSVPNSIFDTSVCVASYRLSLSGPTTVYLKGNIAFSAGTPNAYGRISARRVR